MGEKGVRPKKSVHFHAGTGGRDGTFRKMQAQASAVVRREKGVFRVPAGDDVPAHRETVGELPWWQGDCVADGRQGAWRGGVGRILLSVDWTNGVEPPKFNPPPHVVTQAIVKRNAQATD